MKILSLILATATLGCAGSSAPAANFGAGNIRVSVERGSEWLHDFSLFMGIKKKNPPQIAIWAEDTAGNFLFTIYVTEKLATQSWIAAGGNRRREALPAWSHAQGRRYGDGLYLPTKNEPLPDAVTGATPKGDFTANFRPNEGVERFVVKCEFNHSTDFNAHYPREAKPGSAGYSGGKMGSGQPAVVYAAEVELRAPQTAFTARLIGHSSPDGSDGKIYSDISGITTALHIVKEIRVYVL